MSTGHEELVKSEFWRKKFSRALKTTDANKDGFISNEDFKMVTQRYKDMGSSEEHVKKLDQAFAILCAAFGIVDDETKLTYEQCIENFGKATATLNDVSMFIASSFETVDSDQNGEISFKEWVNCYKAADVDVKYARASFDTMDTNGDGVISKEEYNAYCTEFYFSAEDKLHSSILYGPLD